MKEARRSYRIQRLDLNSVNFVLQQMADRIDELEGRRGTPTFKADMQMDGNRVRGVASAQDSTDALPLGQGQDEITVAIGSLANTKGQMLANNGTVLAAFAVGADGSVLRADSSATVGVAWKETFTSAAQTITSAGALTIAHGLGMTPNLVQTFLRCVTAEYGYSIGDTVSVPVLMLVYNGATNVAKGISLTADSTNLNVRFANYGAGAPWFILNKTTGADVGITAANWSLILRATI